MQNLTIFLQQLMRDNPAIQAAWISNNNDAPQLNVITHPKISLYPLTLPGQLSALPCIHIHGPNFRTLRTTLSGPPAAQMHDACQDEPIKLGTQIQPSGANWFGTAGCPCKWLDPTGNPQYGILSNWHVMADGDEQPGRPQHQPTADYPYCATLAAWTPVRPGADHTTDAAIANARVQGFHTISNELLELGPIGPRFLTSTVGLAVSKSGRTTGVTRGLCVATGASVRVAYDSFTATFHDQDIFEPDSGPFSAPGDSGSIIVSTGQLDPCALLFAGNDQLTVGNPIRHVADALNLVTPFT